MIAQCTKKITSHCNLLGTDALAQSGEGIPLYTIAFLGSRSLILSLLIIITTVVSSFFLNNQETSMNKVLTSMASDERLEMSSTDRKNVKDKPNLVLKKLIFSNKQQISKLKDLIKENDTNQFWVLKPANELVSQTPSCYVKKLDASDEKNELSIEGCNEKDHELLLNKLKDHEVFQLSKNLKDNLQLTF
jgi:hypothetical protein